MQILVDIFFVSTPVTACCHCQPRRTARKWFFGVGHHLAVKHLLVLCVLILVLVLFLLGVVGDCLATACNSKTVPPGPKVIIEPVA